MNKLLKIPYSIYLISFLILILASGLCFFIFIYKIESTLQCVIQTTNYQTILKIDSKYFFKFKEKNRIIIQIGNKKLSTVIKKIKPQIKDNMIEFTIKDELPMLKPNLVIPATIIYEEKTIFEKLIKD